MPRTAAKKAPIRKIVTTSTAPGISVTAPVPERRPSTLHIDIDWAAIPMPEAQMLYQTIKEHFERAGKILNARAMSATQVEFYECFMAGKPKCCAKGTQHRMPARGTDYENGHKDPKSGLVTPVLICSENCWIRYQEVLINERRERNVRAGTV